MLLEDKPCQIIVVIVILLVIVVSVALFDSRVQSFQFTCLMGFTCTTQFLPKAPQQNIAICLVCQELEIDLAFLQLGRIIKAAEKPDVHIHHDHIYHEAQQHEHVTQTIVERLGEIFLQLGGNGPSLERSVQKLTPAFQLAHVKVS